MIFDIKGVTVMDIQVLYYNVHNAINFLDVPHPRTGVLQQLSCSKLEWKMASHHMLQFYSSSDFETHQSYSLLNNLPSFILTRAMKQPFTIEFAVKIIRVLNFCIENISPPDGSAM